MRISNLYVSISYLDGGVDYRDDGSVSLVPAEAFIVLVL